MARLDYHPEFLQQFTQLSETDEAVFEDVALLVDALEKHGHDIEGDDHTADPSHPIVTSTLDLWALRRTPPTGFTPDANTPPVLRIPYVWMIDRHAQDEFALLLFIGDKTSKPDTWYHSAVARVENELIPAWTLAKPYHEARKKRHR